MVGLVEQINTTRDTSDYLWYMTDVKVDANEGFLRNGDLPTLTVLSAGHAMHVFINGQLSGSAYGSLDSPKLTFRCESKSWFQQNCDTKHCCWSPECGSTF